MSYPVSTVDRIRQLQQDLLSLQGYRKVSAGERPAKGLGTMETAFPNGIFPTGAIHELISREPAEAAATNGFISALLSKLQQRPGPVIWVSTRRTLFPPALKGFGIDPERILFIDTVRLKEALWTVEEALKCEAMAAVVGELSGLSFTESRRLQLAVEKSRVTGFIHSFRPRAENTTACIARWKIRPLASATDGLPGVGFPRWQVRLDKVRNGRPGTWQIEWAGSEFRYLHQPVFIHTVNHQLKTG